MCSQAPLHMIFFPHSEAGHMIPMVDMAKLFVSRGVKATIITTSNNAHLIQPTTDRANDSGHNHIPITLLLLPFNPSAAGLPAGFENLPGIPPPDLLPVFNRAVAMLSQLFDQVLRDLLPDCVVTDIFLPWTYDVAAEHGVPRIVFHGTGFFSLCAMENPPPDADSFVLPGFPHRIEMLRSQIPDTPKPDSPLAGVFNQINDAYRKSYGVVVNSFYELEPDYVDLYRNVNGRKVWHLGPVSLCNKHEVDMRGRGNKVTIDGETCLKWLDSKNPGSVVYASFGSFSEFTVAQLREIALGLEASNHPFIWAVRSFAGDWLPENYEERIGDQGLVIRGWAPQILILNHPAVGGFVTHCGWNSILEGVSAGVPMVTWPIFGDQFYNERLIVDVQGIGVSIGVKENVLQPEGRTVVEAVEIERAVCRMMGGGEEAERRRRRAIELGETAKRAVNEGGSSYVDMGNLITELLDRRNAIQREKSDSGGNNSRPIDDSDLIKLDAKVGSAHPL